MSRSAWHSGVSATLALIVGTLAFAATPPAAQKTPTGKAAAPPPVVAIKKVDGSTVRGRLIASDGLHLSIEPAVDKNTFGDAVDIAWKDVKTVSNGLTQKKANDAWKAAHKDELCDVCHGERVTVCEVCKGTGHDPESSKDCKTCKGAQQVACNQPKCDHGKIPCPNDCTKKAPGEKKIGRYTVNWTGSHLGNIIKIDKNGNVTMEVCPTCGGTAKVTCPTCHGTSFTPCPTCKADKKAADCASCEDGYNACSSCAGTGLKGGAAAAIAAPAPTGQLPPPAPPGEVKAGSPAEPKPGVKKSTGDGLD
jgi:hypothetical protein